MRKYKSAVCPLREFDVVVNAWVDEGWEVHSFASLHPGMNLTILFYKELPHDPRSH